jgi:hypothetical protein
MRLADALAARTSPGVAEKARVTGGWEIIGPTACPILARRTIAKFGRFGKVLWHVFLPNASDQDCHDHPRPFITVALRGEYADIQPDGTTDLVRAPTIRYRRAEHAHITRIGPFGCTTLCIMGPNRRSWGFWREGRWWEWRAYERRFGLNFRCDETTARASGETAE